MSDSMTDDQKKEARNQKMKEGLKAFGHLLVTEILPQVVQFALPILVSYLTKKGIDSATTPAGNSPS